MFVESLSPKELLLLYLQDRLLNHAVKQYKYMYQIHTQERLDSGEHQIKALIIRQLHAIDEGEHTLDSRGFNSILVNLKSLIAKSKMLV